MRVSDRASDVLTQTITTPLDRCYAVSFYAAYPGSLSASQSEFFVFLGSHTVQQPMPSFDGSARFQYCALARVRLG